MPRKPKALVLDSWAALAYLGDEASAQEVADLITNRVGLDCRRGSERAVVAVGATACCDRTVTVRTREAGIDDDLVDALSKSFLQPAIVAAKTG